MFQNDLECMHNVPEHMQIVLECSRMFQNDPECMQNVPECFRMHAECFRMFENACRMFQNVPECARMFQNVHKVKHLNDRVFYPESNDANSRIY